MLTCPIVLIRAASKDKMALGGYAELVEYYVKKWEGRQIIVNQAVVENVQWKEGECIVGYRKKKSSSGSKSVRRLVQMHAHSVICTLPLGVLQEKKDLFTYVLLAGWLSCVCYLSFFLSFFLELQTASGLPHDPVRANPISHTTLHFCKRLHSRIEFVPTCAVRLR